MLLVEASQLTDCHEPRWRACRHWLDLFQRNTRLSVNHLGDGPGAIDPLTDAHPRSRASLDVVDSNGALGDCLLNRVGVDLLTTTDADGISRSLGHDSSLQTLHCS